MEKIEIDIDGLQERMIAKALNLDEYTYIMNRIRRTDLSHDRDFQRIYDHFYKVRRNEPWRESYFDYFEKMKDAPDLTFEKVLDALFLMTGNIEASFSSKLIATLFPDMPIWDQYVLKNLGLKMPTGSRSTQLRAAKRLYQEICQWYEEYLPTENATACVQAFDKMLPHYTHISKVKKIDFVLWSNR